MARTARASHGQAPLSWRAALAVAATAVALRLVHVWQMRDSLFASVLLGDSRGYDGWARELAATWGPSGIRVHAIAPGFFHSRMADPVIRQIEPEIQRRNPIGRVGEAGELKGVAVFLASDASSYITGHTVVVDGGGTIV